LHQKLIQQIQICQLKQKMSRLSLKYKAPEFLRSTSWIWCLQYQTAAFNSKAFLNFALTDLKPLLTYPLKQNHKEFHTRMLLWLSWGFLTLKHHPRVLSAYGLSSYPSIFTQSRLILLTFVRSCIATSMRNSLIFDKTSDHCVSTASS